MPMFQYVFQWSLTSLSFFGSKALLFSVNAKTENEGTFHPRKLSQMFI